MNYYSVIRQICGVQQNDKSENSYGLMKKCQLEMCDVLDMLYASLVCRLSGVEVHCVEFFR
jgi:hypothetical protein